MELKPATVQVCPAFTPCLNRTFYGIETYFKSKDFKWQVVLIVPFMELKQRSKCCAAVLCLRLNRTFYGIETGHYDLVSGSR